MKTHQYHTLSITIYDRDKVYRKVGELLHDFADSILLRVGYPIENENVAIIFLILKMTGDDIGALSGRLGQLESVNVKVTTLKI
ncbi:MAG: iron-only hydrogenase system regulator [Candidatus Marinimicrobia bacterium]|nr:iron-only hydrogenase system regulator [Candidatus Neomarinimicrobiota bacterium]MDD5582292.1 iron-only hydrogenase system regulator [Candidatus Neomarinimicrobiota bacterium]